MPSCAREVISLATAAFALGAASVITTVCIGAPLKTLPDALLDCYQSFVVAAALPEMHFDQISIDGDNLKLPRYRIQTVGGTVLKVIQDPTRNAFRKEYGKYVSELTAELTGRAIFAWREPETPGVKFLTLNFEDNLLTVVTLPKAGVPVPSMVRVLLCRKAAGK